MSLGWPGPVLPPSLLFSLAAQTCRYLPGDTGVDSGYGAAAVDTAMNLRSPQGFGKREGPGWTLAYLRYLADGTHGCVTL